MMRNGRKNVVILGANKELQEAIFNLTYLNREISICYDIVNFEDFSYPDIIVILSKSTMSINILNKLFNLNISIIAHKDCCEELNSKIKDFYSLFVPIYKLEQFTPGIYSEKNLSQKNLIVSN